MNTRSVATLGGIAAIVAVLALARGDGGARTPDPAVDPAPTAALPTILDFGRGTCVACKQMMPILDEVRDAYRGVVDVRYLDLAEPANVERSRELQVRLIPTQIFVAADGTELFRHEGLLPREEIDRKLVELGWISDR